MLWQKVGDLKEVVVAMISPSADRMSLYDI
jgi:hypothetical protein